MKMLCLKIQIRSRDPRKTHGIADQKMCLESHAYFLSIKTAERASERSNKQSGCLMNQWENGLSESAAATE